jgi:hypothetical protein
MTRLLIWFLAPALALAGVPSLIAIRGAHVVPVGGPEMAQATVVVRDGVIEAVGPNAAIPQGAWVIDGKGLTVYPGFVDALDDVGIPAQTAPAAPAAPRAGAGAAPAPPPARGPEDRPSTESWLRAADLVRPGGPHVHELRSAGFTTAVSFPMQGIFAGQGAVIDLGGERAGDMVVETPAGEYITTGTRGFASYPGSLMGVIAYIRQLYLDAGYYKTVRAAYDAHQPGVPRPAYDRAIEGVLESQRILLPAGRLVEIDRMMRFGKELGQKTVLYGMAEGYRAGDLLKGADVGVLINMKWPEAERDGDPNAYVTLRTLEVRQNAPSSAAVLAKAGVPFAFYSGGLTTRTALVRAMRRALDAGLSRADAVRALTLAPAGIYGVADRLGTIEKGKIANLTVTDGDWFEEKTKVKFVLVDGKKYEPEPEMPPPPPAANGRGRAPEVAK